MGSDCISDGLSDCISECRCVEGPGKGQTLSVPCLGANMLMGEREVAVACKLIDGPLGGGIACKLWDEKRPTVPLQPSLGTALSLGTGLSLGTALPIGTALSLGTALSPLPLSQPLPGTALSPLPLSQPRPGRLGPDHNGHQWQSDAIKNTRAPTEWSEQGFVNEPRDSGFVNEPRDSGFVNEPRDSGFGNAPLGSGFVGQVLLQLEIPISVNRRVARYGAERGCFVGVKSSPLDAEGAAELRMLLADGTVHALIMAGFEAQVRADYTGLITQG